jgi:hypothetical protein
MDKQSPQSSVGAERTMPFAAEVRHQMISIAAYYRAERRAFRGGDPIADWLEAEAEIDRTPVQSSSSGQPPAGETKRAFQETLQSQLKEFDARLEGLAEEAHKAKRSLKAEYEKQIGALGEKRALAGQKLRELEGRSEAAWEDLKDGAERLWRDLRQTIEQMASRFK